MDLAMIDPSRLRGVISRLAEAGPRETGEGGTVVSFAVPDTGGTARSYDMGILDLLAFIGIVQYVEPPQSVQVTSVQATFLLRMLLELLGSGHTLVGDWQRRGIMTDAPHPFGSAVDLLAALEFRRRELVPHAAPLREIDAAIAVIEQRQPSRERAYLLHWDQHASMWQLVGGRFESVDQTLHTTMLRELEEELAWSPLVEGEQVSLEELGAPFSEERLSPSFGLYSRTHFQAYRVRLLVEPPPLHTDLRWISEHEILAGTTSDGLAISSAPFRRLATALALDAVPEHTSEDSMDDRFPQLSLSYRKEVLGRLMPALRGGECCSLLGVSGVGKSNLTQFMRRFDVQAAYGFEDTTWVLLIDRHSLVLEAQSSAYAVLELMVHRMIMEAERRSIDETFISRANELYAHLMQHRRADIALRYLEQLCGLLCEKHDVRLIFVFDQFEDVWKTNDAAIFLNLRYIRDQFKYRVVYAFLTRDHLSRTRPNYEDAQAFADLFVGHIHGIGMYSRADAEEMIARIAGRSTITLDHARTQHIIAVGGGHPGLMRAVFWAIQQAGTTLDEQQLADNEAVRNECAQVWNDLREDEQQYVSTLARKGTSTDPSPVLDDLRIKQVVGGDTPTLFSSLFSAFVRSQEPIDQPQIVVNLRQRKVWTDGTLVEQRIGRQEFILLTYLVEHSGQVCDREEILKALYTNENADPNDQRLDDIVRRLRRSIGDDARDPRFIKTHRGAGFQLLHCIRQD